MRELLTSDAVTITEVRSQQDRDKEFVYVSFSKTPQKKGNRLRRGWYLLDPAYYWIVRKGELTFDLGSDGIVTQSFEHEYKSGRDGFPMVNRTSLFVKNLRENRDVPTYEHVAVAELQERENVPEGEFTLAAYDLPEPFGLTPKPTRWYLWAGVAAIVCLVGAGVLRYLQRRAAVPQTA